MRRLFTCIYVSLLALTGLQAQENYVLDNGKVRAVFSGGDTFQVEEILLNGRMVASKGSSTFWHITCLGPNGETPSFRPKHGKYQGAKASREGEVSSLTFTWNMRFDYSGKVYPFRAIISLPDNADRLFFGLEAELPEGWWVTETDYPELILEKPEDAKIITTGGWGVEYPLTSVKKTALYPTTSCSMQFVMVHNRDGALYFGTEDPSGSGKSYNVDGNGALNLSLSVPASEAWTTDGTFTLPFAANIGFDKEGWEHAVNHWYKPYSYTLPWGGEFVREFTPGGKNPRRKFVKYWEDTVVMGAEWKDRNGNPAWILVNTDTKAHKVKLPSMAPVKHITVPASGAIVVR